MINTPRPSREPRDTRTVSRLDAVAGRIGSADQATRSEALLTEAKPELWSKLDFIPCLAWRARPGGFAEYLNKRWLDFTGLTLEQALGWQWQATIHPEDLRGLNRAWREILAAGTSGKIEARMRRSDGTYHRFIFRIEPFHDSTGAIVAWYGTNTEIEGRKRFHDVQLELARPNCSQLWGSSRPPSHAKSISPSPRRSPTPRRCTGRNVGPPTWRKSGARSWASSNEPRGAICQFMVPANVDISSRTPAR
jgi:PAS domain S-box-containing protein